MIDPAQRTCHLCGVDEPFAVVALAPAEAAKGTAPPGAIGARVTLCPRCFHAELSGGRLKPGAGRADPFTLTLQPVTEDPS